MPYEHKIITLLYSDYEALDVFGPIGAIVPRSDFYKVEFVTLNSIQNEKGVESSIKNGIATPTSKTIDEVISSKEEFDTLFIPGGFGFLPLIWDPFLLKKIAILVDQAPNVFTVCTGSLLLAATGKLEGRKATTNKRLFDDQTPRHPAVKWQKKARWVEDGKFLTSSGVTAGIDAGFAFISRTYIAPEDRTSEKQKIDKTGDKTSIPGYNAKKATGHAHFVAFGLEYAWNTDAGDDNFVDLPAQRA